MKPRFQTIYSMVEKNEYETNLHGSDVTETWILKSTQTAIEQFSVKIEIKL